jgi:hypothetical protein
LKASDWAANFSRFKTAISWASLSMKACLKAISQFFSLDLGRLA